MKNRIFIVSQGPWGMQKSGLARIATHIAEELEKSYEVYFFTMAYSENAKRSYTSKKLGKSNYIIMDACLLTEYLSQINPEFLITIGENWMFNELLNKHETFPFTSWIHYVPVDSIFTIAQDMKKFYIACDVIIPTTPGGEKCLRENGIICHKFIPHSIDTNIFYPMDKSELRKEYGFSNDDFIVGYVGRNQMRKNIDKMLKMWSEFIKIIPNSKLLLHTNVDDNERTFDIKKLCEYLGITDSVHITTQYPSSDEDLNIFYNLLDVYLSTSMAEGFNFPAFEAMSTGTTPVLTDNVPHTFLLSLIPEDIKKNLLIKTEKKVKTPEGTTWVEFNIESAIECLKFCYEYKNVMRMLKEINTFCTYSYDRKHIDKEWTELIEEMNPYSPYKYDGLFSTLLLQGKNDKKNWDNNNLQ